MAFGKNKYNNRKAKNWFKKFSSSDEILEDRSLMTKNWRHWLTLIHLKFINNLQEDLILTKKLLAYTCMPLEKSDVW